MPNKFSERPDDIFVSTVIVAEATISNLAGYIIDLQRALVKKYINYEIIIICNGVQLLQVAQVTKLLETIPCIRLISLSRVVAYDAAVFAGLECAIGDYVCTVNPTIDSIKNVTEIIELNKRHEIVQGVSIKPFRRTKIGGSMGRRAFYWYNRKHVGIDIPLHATYFASYSRRAINALTALHQNRHHIRHAAQSTGYNVAHYEYDPEQDPSSERSLRTGAISALEIVTHYSVHPLRFVTWLGVLAGIANITYAIYVIVINVFKHTVEGWTTLSLQTSLMFCVLFFILVILSEYIGRILSESRQDPAYYIGNEVASSVSVSNELKRNVTG